jgi:glycosyltransferase involved in cell wall biosynthesis
MKIGLLITTYNRPDYLEKCLGSLNHSDLNSDVEVLIVDDCSTDKRTIELIESGYLESNFYSVMYNQNKSGISQSIITGYTHLFANGCDVVINLDGDAVVCEDFFSKMQLLIEQFPGRIITGFNSLVTNSLGKARHPILKSYGNCHTKKSCGGINMAMNEATFRKYVEPACQQVLKDGKGNWDELACKAYSATGMDIIVSNPSIVQHIGLKSAMGHHERPCVATDFKYCDNDTKDIIVMNQFAGLGDILFCIKIANDYIEDGHRVIWAVDSQFINIQKHFPDITFVDKKLLAIDYNSQVEVKGNGFRVIPMRWSQNIMKVTLRECMKSKYALGTNDWNAWKEWRDFEWVRDEKSEDLLFSMLGLDSGDEYIVVNTAYKTQIRTIPPIAIESNCKIINMEIIDGFTLLDWYKVLQNAKQIHTVSTSIIYMLEKMELNAEAVCIYIRKPEEQDLKNIDYILTDKHKYILE